MKHLFLGGARSGKSRLAEEASLACAAQQYFYIATGWAGDAEMQARIGLHQQQRDKRWQLKEIQTALAEGLIAIDDPDHVVLIDCLTLWLSNCLHHGQWQAQKTALLAVLPQLQARVFMVSNEVGAGIVPLGS